MGAIFRADSRTTVMFTIEAKHILPFNPWTSTSRRQIIGDLATRHQRRLARDVNCS
jgi:hypothetical protein